MLKRALSMLLVLVALPAVVSGQIRVGPEFQVNTYTPGSQSRPSVASDAAGNFVVVWESYQQDGNLSGVFARWHDASGTPLGGAEVRVNAYTPGQQRDPAVASTSDGRVVVVWESGGQDGSGSGIFARQYASAAAAPSPEFQVNSYTTLAQGAPSVAADASGNFVVVWHSAQDGSNYGIVGRRYDALGNPRGGEFLVNSYTTSNQNNPSVASDANGNFVVAWESWTQDGSLDGVYAQRYDAAGARVGGEFKVNSYTTNGQQSAAVASDADGNFVVTWASSHVSPGDVRAQRYDAAGAKRGDEFRVNVRTTEHHGSPAITSDPDGSFVVVWTSYASGKSVGTFARRYEDSGTPEGAEFRLHAYTISGQSGPTVASDARGNFVALWASNGQDGSASGVFGQRFVPDVIFRDGFEDGTLGAWSASSTDAGDLSVSPLAGLKFTTAGVQGVVDDTVGIYVQDDTPDDEDHYRARFYFDPNGFDPGEAQNRRRTRIFVAFSEAPNRRLVAIVLKRIGGAYSIRGRARLDDNSQADTPFIPITDQPHIIEFDLLRASGPGGADGYFELAIDGSWVSYLPLDNSLSAVDFVRMGALSVKPGATGTMYWDEFESRRLQDIGP